MEKNNIPKKIQKSYDELGVNLKSFVVNILHPLLSKVNDEDKTQTVDTFHKALDKVTDSYNELESSITSIFASQHPYLKDKNIAKQFQLYIANCYELWNKIIITNSSQFIILEQIETYLKKTMPDANPESISKEVVSILTQAIYGRVYPTKFKKAFVMHDRNSRFKKAKEFYSKAFEIDMEFFELVTQLEALYAEKNMMVNHNGILKSSIAEHKPLSEIKKYLTDQLKHIQKRPVKDDKASQEKTKPSEETSLLSIIRKNKP